MMAPLTQLLADALGGLRHPIESTSGERADPSALLASAAQLADELSLHASLPDEPVLVRMGNRPSDLGTLLGVWQAGAVAVPLHVAAAPATVERLQRKTQARFVVDADGLGMMARPMPPSRPLLCDAALVIFTSGSTGEPKGVVIAHGLFAGKLDALDPLLGLRADDVVLLPLQLNFIFGLWVSLLALRRRARLVLVPRFSREAIERGLGDATVLAGVPSMYRALLADAAPSAPRLRMLLTGGEVLAPKLADAMRRLGDAAIYDLYGLTETGSCDFCLAPADQPGGFGSIGKPTNRVTFRIAPDGELQIDTPYAMLGYLDDPDLTAASFEHGYFKTGDRARLTASGNVALVGRAKDIVSRGGHKIAPLEIDNLLAEHPDVAAALCAGVPDDRLGEVIHAVVVPRAGCRLDEAALREWLVARTERFKVPDVFHVRDALPVGSTGKADRRAVAALAAAKS
jgi:long-chain acyl-CoA synthetase